MLGEFNQQQARKTSIQLGVPTDFIKKDYFVTKAIQTLTNIEDEYFSLVFQGGTSLSKGYQVIRRLSEDDLGYFDEETCRVEPLDNPFGPKVLPMSTV